MGMEPQKLQILQNFVIYTRPMAIEMIGF